MARRYMSTGAHIPIWVVVKIMVSFWVPIIIRHLLFRVPKRDLNFDNHPSGSLLGFRPQWVCLCVLVWGRATLKPTEEARKLEHH